MIAVINNGRTKGPTGMHHYRLQINDEVLAEFWHRREEGLGECLRRAAIAADKCNLDRLVKYVEALESEGQEAIEL